MYGHQVVKTFNRIHQLGLTDSPHNFSVKWCGRNGNYLYDFFRRSGMNRRVRPELVTRIRSRLADVASVASDDLASEVRALDAVIARDVAVADLLGRADRFAG